MTAGQRPILFKGWMSVFVNPKKTNPYKTVRSVGQPLHDSSICSQTIIVHYTL